MNPLPSFLHPFASPSATDFVSIASGDGALLTTTDGRTLIDGMASLWYCAVGHGRREIADAVAAQMRSLAAYSCFDPFTNPVADELADQLVQRSPLPGARVFFTSSGSESVDTAIKLARAAHVQAGHPERTLIVSRDRAYHGATYGGMSAQGLPPNKVGFGPLLPDVVQVPADDIEALATLMAEHGERVAAVITEPVQGAGGVFPPPDGYLEGMRRLCDRHGAFLVFDEVICAFGRLGKWFGAERFGVTPDMITFAKGVTSGYVPLGGVVVGPKVRAGLEADPDYVLRHGFTYSGHAAACAAALANMAVIEAEQLLDRAVHVGARLEAGLRALAADDVLADVRGDTAVWAVRHQPGRDPFAVRNRMLELGVIVRAVGSDTNVFCPPLVTTDEQIDRIVDVLAEATADVAAGGAATKG